jgi:hypothetical protein
MYGQLLCFLYRYAMPLISKRRVRRGTLLSFCLPKRKKV